MLVFVVQGTLWQTNIAMEYPHHLLIGNTSSKGPFSIAMLVYRSVCILVKKRPPRKQKLPLDDS